MQVIRDNPEKQILRSSVVTIGNFDGFHTGHQALLEKARSLAGGDKPVAVVTFEPLPQAWFRPETAPARLMSVRQKLQYLAGANVNLVWLMRFNQALANMQADEFVKRVLVETLGASEVVVGDDFHYGTRRQGDTVTLKQAGDEYGFGLNVVSAVELNGVRVSSSGIRELMAVGELNKAEKFRGNPYRTQGRIIKGQQLGRTLGYPTANMRAAVLPSPIQGVFAVRARLCDGDTTERGWRDAIASLGTRPAVGGEGFLIEVHLFDFDGDLYGRKMEVEYIEKLRDEAHFTELDDLVAQMREDERLARQSLLRAARSVI
jgi:riboflavin kinase/FMN adenylyltransferase